MKRIYKFIIGLTLLLSFSSNVFAKNIGYVWLLSGSRYYDKINYGNSDYNYLLGMNFGKTLPDVNSIIKIEPKNRIYFGFSFIQDITTNFLDLVENGKCPKEGGAFSNYMLNIKSDECLVDKVVGKIKRKYGYHHKNFNSYYELQDPIKAKVLGYVIFKAGMFMLVEQTELLEKDK
ncbi:hypothetical protein Arnit_1528 [Arcobacter nitrofigilis DSM 7299]|uniref:Uncharacterized protein n=1 Tax=Arcobacter nitrofigilis (strain ATCC 33309 / DSM 7299 / CCUG 15893 / LMG 7604 / NCTC 12251 / CI) TaxID=572480 RepID=D5V617_ARCNC|nr:hypothetical protein [Arcobacter nitrofigilis]ADG93184.1 hypothetical protein Arnit_1528 [Arcobacter nitrofigilis DSM 7299]